MLLGHGTVAATVELFLAVAATCVASAILGLAISALVRSSEQIMPLFVVAVMAQLVLCGGMVPVTGRLGLDQLSFAMPARWGYAAAASTVDLRHLVPDSLLSQDRFWQHTIEDLAARHGHAGRAVVVLSRLRPVEDPAAPLTVAIPIR